MADCPACHVIIILQDVCGASKVNYIWHIKLQPFHWLTWKGKKNVINLTESLFVLAQVYTLTQLEMLNYTNCL